MSNTDHHSSKRHLTKKQRQQFDARFELIHARAEATRASRVLLDPNLYFLKTPLTGAVQTF